MYSLPSSTILISMFFPLQRMSRAATDTVCSSFARRATRRRSWWRSCPPGPKQKKNMHPKRSQYYGEYKHKHTQAHSPTTDKTLAPEYLTHTLYDTQELQHLQICLNGFSDSRERERESIPLTRFKLGKTLRKIDLLLLIRMHTLSQIFTNMYFLQQNFILSFNEANYPLKLN